MRILSEDFSFVQKKEVNLKQIADLYTKFFSQINLEEKSAEIKQVLEKKKFNVVLFIIF